MLSENKFLAGCGALVLGVLALQPLNGGNARGSWRSWTSGPAEAVDESTRTSWKWAKSWAVMVPEVTGLSARIAE